MELPKRYNNVYTYDDLLLMLYKNNVPYADALMKMLMRGVDNEGLWGWIAMQNVVDSCFQYIEEAKKNDKKGNQ